jgi:DNA polymerase III subunit gamma/tau
VNFYRTYRPQHFSDLLEQQLIARLLQQALLQKRLSHAYLFTGPRGTGKTSTARILARAACCEQPVIDTAAGTYEPCLTCAACTSITTGSSTDWLEIDAASNRGIDDIRELREQSAYPPHQLKRRVYLIDEVHMLTGDAFNAFLKTLEEPAEHCLFLLATTELHKVPLTIRSRCQILRLQPAGEEAIVEKLQHIAAAENLQVESSALQVIARHAGGAFRDAEGMLEALATAVQPLTEAAAAQQLGLPPAEQVSNLVDLIVTGSLEQLLTTLRAAVQVATSEGTTLELVRQLRTRLDQRLADKQAKAAEALAYASAIRELHEGFILLRHSPTPGLALELAVLRAAEYFQRLNEGGGGNEISQNQPKNSRVDALVIQADSLPAAELTITPISTPLTSQVPVIELREADEPTTRNKGVRGAWKQAIATLSQERPVLAQILRDTVIHSVEGNVITVAVRFRFHSDTLNDPKHMTRITQLLEESTGDVWRVSYQLNPAAAPRPTARRISTSVDEATSVFSEPPAKPRAKGASA